MQEQILNTKDRIHNQNNVQSNKRDYNKDPLIIKNYQTFCSCCMVISMAIAFFSSFYIFDPNFGNYNNDDSKGYKTSHSAIGKKERESEARQKTAMGVLNFFSYFGKLFPIFKYIFNFIRILAVIFFYMRVNIL